MRGAWIEIKKDGTLKAEFVKSLPMRGAWIEILTIVIGTHRSESLPMRGAWIEI